MFDLHAHSTASDGSLTPTALLALASKSGMSGLALTDHDTIRGLAEARLAAAEHAITLINGVEISAGWNNRTVHILGLGIDPRSPLLNAALADAEERRRDRGRLIGERLEQKGVGNAYQLTCELAGNNLVGRAHFARMLVEQRVAKDNKQVFRRFMVRGKPGYVAANWMAMDEAIGLIRRSGGAAVLAHPAAYTLTTRKLKLLMGEFSAAGGDGIEVASGNAEQAEIERLATLANEFGLMASSGSDFHGPDKPWLRLGQNRPVPERCTPIWHHQALAIDANRCYETVPPK